VQGAAGPIKDVNKLKTVAPAIAAKIKAACGVHAGVLAASQPLTAMPELVTKPGKERWAVKTGQDADRDAVGKNIVSGQNLGAGIVPATVEELISMPRPAGLEVLTADPPQFQNKRAQPVETTIWRVEGTVTVLKLEADGDYHLVLEGASGATMVAEVPTPTKAFVGDSPWIANIKEARQAVDDKLVHNLNPRDFVLPPRGNEIGASRRALRGLSHSSVGKFQDAGVIRDTDRSESAANPYVSDGSQAYRHADYWNWFFRSRSRRDRGCPERD
jgi:hypothetical protein